MLQVRSVRWVVVRGLCCRATGVRFWSRRASRQHVYASQGGDAIQRLALPINYGVQVRNGTLRLVYQATRARFGGDYVAHLYEVPGTLATTDSTTHARARFNMGNNGNPSRKSRAQGVPATHRCVGITGISGKQLYILRLCSSNVITYSLISPQPDCHPAIRVG